jgi:hypothetical protein
MLINLCAYKIIKPDFLTSFISTSLIKRHVISAYNVSPLKRFTDYQTFLPFAGFTIGVNLAT